MKKVLATFIAVAMGLNISAQEECMNPDINCDGYVNIYDLLGLLGYFDDEDLDGDGVWDSQDDCVDDGCGICDGPGPQVLVVDTITFTTDSTFIDTIDQWYFFEIPDTTFTFVCANPGCTDPTAENYDPDATENDWSCIGGAPCSNELTAAFYGYTYDLVAIGDQCWFAENLRTESYANGDPLPFGLNGFQWTAADQNGNGAGAVYGEEDASCTESAPDFYACDEELALDAYGRLYNGHAVVDSRGICPVGWHVPSDEEWTTLETVVGSMAGVDSVGAVLKAPAGWVEEGNGTDDLGFGGLPGGNRSNGFGDFNNAGVNGYWWSSTLEGGAYWYRSLSAGITTVGRYQSLPRLGFSVRCLRDAD